MGLLGPDIVNGLSLQGVLGNIAPRWSNLVALSRWYSLQTVYMGFEWREVQIWTVTLVRSIWKIAIWPFLKNLPQRWFSSQWHLFMIGSEPTTAFPIAKSWLKTTETTKIWQIYTHSRVVFQSLFRNSEGRCLLRTYRTLRRKPYLGCLCKKWSDWPRVTGPNLTLASCATCVTTSQTISAYYRAVLLVSIWSLGHSVSK